MPRFNAPFEIHVHGQIPLRADVSQTQVIEALKPLCAYVGVRSFSALARSVYEDEPGLQVNLEEHCLQMCWTVAGDDDFRQVLDELCMNLNELCVSGSAIEITFYDKDFEDGEEQEVDQARDDFYVLFVGPSPAAIMQVQRDLLVQDLVSMMERHFDGAELSGVVAEVDKLFAARFDALVNSLDISKPPKGSRGGYGGVRKPRHLH